MPNLRLKKPVASLLAIALLLSSSLGFAKEPADKFFGSDWLKRQAQKKAIEDAVREKINAPEEGTRFRNLRLLKGGTMFCGEIHVKEQAGGYSGISVGFRPFRGVLRSCCKTVRIYVMEVAAVDNKAEIEAIESTCKRYELSDKLKLQKKEEAKQQGEAKAH